MALDSVGNVWSRYPKTILPILTGLGALYLALWINHALLQPNLRITPVVLAGIITGILFFLVRWLTAHRKLPLTWSQSIVAAITGTVILHSLFHFYYLSQYSGTRNLVLLALGILAFFLSLERLALVLASTLGIWVIVAVSSGPSYSWLHFAFGLFLASGLKLYTVYHRQELSHALSTADDSVKLCQQMEKDLEAREQQFQRAFDSSPDGFWQWDCDRNAISFSRNGAEMMGLPPETSVTPSNWLRLIRGCYRNNLKGLLTRVTPSNPEFEEEFEVLRGEDGMLWLRLCGRGEFDSEGKLTRLYGWQSDLSQLKATQRRLVQSQIRDGLTGLANRALFLKRLGESLTSQVDDSVERGVAVLLVDLDRFRVLNQRLGAQGGDYLLTTVGMNLQSRGEAALVARLEADRFALLYRDLPNPLAAIKLGGQILKLCSQPLRVSTEEVVLSASIGIAWGNRGDAPEEMLRQAHVAVREAKARGANRFTLYDREQDQREARQLALESDLTRALQYKQLVLVHQPVVALRNSRIVGLSTEIRWKHPQRGHLFYKQFASAAENSDLDSSMCWWALEETCGHLNQWQRRIQNPIFGVSTRLCGKQFEDLHLVERILSLLSNHKIDPTSLRLEVTEKAIKRREREALAMLTELQEAGVQIHLAEFGTCDSSHLMLSSFDFDAVRIDASFMQLIESNSIKRRTLRSILLLADDLAMDVIADGLDSARQVEIAESLSCEFGQGAYFWPALGGDLLQKVLDESAGQKLARASSQ